MSKFFNTKLRVISPYNKFAFNALQQELILRGCQWSHRPFGLRDEPEAFGILVDHDGIMTWTRKSEDFFTDPRYEVSYSVTAVVELCEPVRSTVTVLGKVYDAAEFSRAIENLREVKY